MISSLDILSLERRMVQFWARLLSMTEMILWRRPMVPINLRSSIDPSTDYKYNATLIINFLLYSRP